MSNKYHDEDFEGVVIKLKDWFLELNPNVKDAIDNLYKELKSANLSVHEPNYVKSLYELKNLGNKRNEINENKKIAEANRLLRIKKEKEEKEELLKYNEIPCVVEENRIYLQNNNDTCIELEDGETLTLWEFMTERENIKVPLKRKLENECNDYEKLQKFIERNPSFKSINDYIVCDYIKNNINFNIRVNNQGLIIITHNCLCAEIYYMKKDGLYSTREKLYINPNGGVKSYFDTTIKNEINFNDYTLFDGNTNHIKLVKKIQN